MEKRGELTSQQLITIIILIVSFTIILIFFFSLNLKSEVTSESCRNSVVLRGTSLGASTSLNCKTQDFCISGGKDCDSSGKDTVTAKAKTEGEVMDKLADLMYTCWYQMGEGKVDYAPRGYGFSETYCNICNTINFDSNLQADVKEINMGDFYKYLQSKKAPNSDNSYLYYLLGVNSLDSVKDKILADTTASGLPYNIYEQKIELGNPKGYAIITGVSKEGFGPAIIAGGAAAVAGIAIGIVTFPTAGAGGAAAGVTTYQGVKALFNYGKNVYAVAGSGAKGAGLGSGAGLFVTNGDKQYLSPMIYPFEGEVIQKLNCKEFTSTS